MNNKNIIYFLTKRFPNEQTAIAYCTKMRWGKKVSCPFDCKDSKIYLVSSSQPYKCSACRRRFSIRTGTFMESSKISVRVWLLAMYLMANSKTGVSSVEMSKLLGITQKTAWFLAHRIRHTFKQVGRLSGTVEVDETYVGGKAKNKHASQKALKGVVGKAIVFGAKERQTGRVVCKVIDRANKTTLVNLILKIVIKGSDLFTDKSPCYQGLRAKGYKHRAVNHSKGEYVRGEVSTNSIDSFWSLLKNAIRGTYTHLSAKHLQRYLDELTCRQTNSDFVALSCESKVNRLSYTQLTGVGYGA